MIFGSKTRFAIESETHDLETEFVLGQICFWSNDRKIGDDEQRIMLAPIADYLRETLDDQGQRPSTVFTGFSPEQVLDQVDTALYGDAANLTGAQAREQWQHYKKFCICPNGCEAFDGELAVWLEDADGERWIWRDYLDRQVYETRLHSAEYETTVRAFLDWLSPLVC